MKENKEESRGAVYEVFGRIFVWIIVAPSAAGIFWELGKALTRIIFHD